MYLPMIDTMLFFLDIENYDDVIDTLADKLENKKEEAKSALKTGSSKLITITIDDMTFEVLPNGKKGYAYILHNDFYEVDIAEYRSKNKDFYPIYIKLKSECLWANGPYKAVNLIWSWIERNIGNICTDKISRVDLCCHTDTFKIEPNDLDKFKGQFYTMCVHYYRRKINAMTFGSSASNKIYCRIYDKVLEVNMRKSKLWFYHIWNEVGMVCNKVWNIEFQMNREFLKEHKIDKVSDVFENIRSLWEYSSQYWLVKIELDNENVSRCSINKKWLKVQECFREYESKPLIKREKQLNMDAEAMVPATYGNITTYAAKLGLKDPAMVMRMLHRSGEEYLESKKLNFKKVVDKKESLLEREAKVHADNNR